MIKVSIVSEGSPDYLIDIIADGFVRLLGRNSLHLKWNTYRPPRPTLSHLFEGFDASNTFDLCDGDVLIISVRTSLGIADEWRKKYGKKRPIVVIDGEHSGGIRKRYSHAATVYFKGEFLKAGKYSENIKPLPFAAIPEQIPDVPRTNDVCFIYKPTHPLRSEVGDALSRMGYPPQSRRSKEQFNVALASSAIGVSVRGRAWDTTRYWEIPYFGAALLSFRPGIVIPENFIEDEEAVFFEDIPDFRRKLTALLSDPNRIRRIAARGQDACRSRHLSTHRAKYILNNLRL